MKFECDRNGCTGHAQFYIFVDEPGLSHKGFFACSSDVGEIQRRIGIISKELGGTCIGVMRVEALLPLALAAIQANRDKND